MNTFLQILFMHSEYEIVELIFFLAKTQTLRRFDVDEPRQSRVCENVISFEQDKYYFNLRMCYS